MLCLTRNIHQSVTLILPDGRHIVVKADHLDGNRFRLLFDAPEDVKILRTELLNKETA